MPWHPPEPLDPSEWRRRAEELLGPDEAEDLREVETARVVHELRVHQLELEMQNEALGEARTIAEAGWERFQELYDSAPAGFFSVDGEGAILELNLAAARLLGAERPMLMNRRLGQFLDPAGQAVFAGFLQSALADPGTAPCEVLLPGAGRVRLHPAPSADGKVLQMAAIGIGDREARGGALAGELDGPLARLEACGRRLREGAGGDGAEQIGQDIETACRKLRELAERI